MSIVLAHPTGNMNVRAVLKGLDEANILAEFHTSLVADASAIWLKFLPSRLRNEWLRRTYPKVSKNIFSHPLLEVARMLMPVLGFKGPVKNETGWASIDAVYRKVDVSVSRRLAYLAETSNLQGVYAYEDGALNSFKEAKKLGIKCIYDLPIAYWETSRRLLEEEADRLPDWAHTLGGGIQDSQLKLNRKTLELEMADVVICPGQFVKESLPIWAANKHVITSPFGSPPALNGQLIAKDPRRTLRVLFAGSMGQRKGLGDLLAAFKILNHKHVELVIMGSPLAPMDFYKKAFNNFTFEPGRQHDKVLELMRSCDVLCLPSIVEGRALVIQEAMSQGLPVIITKNTGGADLIIEGQTGFLVPIRSPEAIAEKITWFLNNRSAVQEMGYMAMKHASTYTWEQYRNEITAGLKSFLSKTVS